MLTLLPTLYIRTFPRIASWRRDLTLIVLGALFVAIFAQVKIPLPFTPIPLTGQTFAVLVVAAALGYLVGFILAASVVGLLAERGLERNIRTSIIPFLVGTVTIYACGVIWLSILFGDFSKAIAAGLTPFLIGDIIKLIAAALILPAAWKLAK